MDALQERLLIKQLGTQLVQLREVSKEHAQRLGDLKGRNDRLLSIIEELKLNIPHGFECEDVPCACSRAQLFAQLDERIAAPFVQLPAAPTLELVDS
jgi:hypothetical protein